MSTDTYKRDKLTNFYRDLEMPGGWAFNQPSTLQMVDLYYNSQYKTGKYDPQGYRKFFYTVGKPTCDIATKFIDIDTGNITLHPENSGEETKLLLMQKRLKMWLKENHFGELLNELTFYWPIYGHFVIKKSAGKWNNVPIQNLRMDVSAKTLKSSGYVYEVMQMSKDEIDEMEWDTGELYSRGEDDSFVIYDCYEKSGKKWKHTVTADLWSYKTKDGLNRSVESEINREGEDWAGAIELVSEEIDTFPYRELKWEPVPGRWMGRGFMEYLEDNQISRNETENLERKGLIYSSLKIWQTRDDSLGGQNVFTRARNGDILRVESEVTPVDVAERNLAQFNSTRANWDANTERKTFTTDITTGGSLPSRTPLGVANLQASLASSFFDGKRESLGMFIKNLLLEDVIPDFQKDDVKEQTLVFGSGDEELEWLDKAIADTMVADAVDKYATKTGWFPSKEERELIRVQISDKLKGKKNRYLKIPASFWKNAKYNVEIDITGESMDVSAESQIIQIALNIIGTNPGIMQNPMAKALLFKLMTLGGVNPAQLNLTAQTQPTVAPQVAGSIASPQTTAGAGVSTQTL